MFLVIRSRVDIDLMIEKQLVVAQKTLRIGQKNWSPISSHF
jgi:hypothetical protein